MVLWWVAASILAQPGWPRRSRQDSGDPAGRCKNWRMRVTSSARGIVEESAEPRGRAPSRPWIDVLLVVALLPMALVARRPRYLFSHSFFLDEGWVADSVRAPLAQVRLLTSSTPIGWTLLLRLVPPVGGPERYRLLPLAFAALTALATWRLGRMLGPDRWSWLSGLCCGSPGRPRRRC